MLVFGDIGEIARHHYLNFQITINIREAKDEHRMAKSENLLKIFNQQRYDHPNKQSQMTTQTSIKEGK